MGIQRYTESCMEGGGVVPSKDGEFVEYKDHAASHVYDEAKEKAAHMAWFQDSEKHVNEYDQSWYGWSACGKSRASA